jgi:hypothetical protein
MGEGRKMYRILMGKPEGKKPLERPRHSREYRIEINLTEVGWVGVD